MQQHFNPRAPRGARPPQMVDMAQSLIFQSTCPARGTTHPLAAQPSPFLFQSTCPARGTTVPYFAGRYRKLHFNPRAPRGARRQIQSKDEGIIDISIHVPREGHDSSGMAMSRKALISIHVPREGHDSKHAQFFRADLRKSYKYPAERDALPTKNVCKHRTLG